MRYLIAAITLVLVSGTANAIKLEITIDPGPALTRLGAVCDLLRADPDFNDPGMTNNQCARRFMVMGARWYNAKQTRAAATAQMGSTLTTESESFDADLPLPTAEPTPTPAATPTVTPTATPVP